MEAKIRYGGLRGYSEDGKPEFIISTSTRDRHKTILNPEGWNLDNYRKNPIVGYQHNIYGSMFGDDNPDMLLGHSEVYLDTAGDLIGVPEFEPEDINPLAAKIAKKIKFGTIRATSVGFYPLANDKGEEGYYGKGAEARGKENETYYFYGQELLEWSIVNLPSNPDAIKNAIPKDKAEFIKHILTEALGDKFNEKLTVKGILGILSGGDLEKMIEEDTGVKMSADVINMIYTVNKNSLKL